MLNLKKIILMSGMTAVIALTGCKSESQSSSQFDALNRANEQEGRKVDDKTINAAIEHGLEQDPAYKFPEVDVRTFDGVVQLSGFANTEGQKQRASEIAQHQQGVTQVINSISLKPMAATGR